MYGAHRTAKSRLGEQEGPSVLLRPGPFPSVSVPQPLPSTTHPLKLLGADHLFNWAHAHTSMQDIRRALACSLKDRRDLRAIAEVIPSVGVANAEVAGRGGEPCSRVKGPK